MPWETRECPVGATDLDACQAPGCRALARFRFLTINSTTGEHRTAFRCDGHAGELRSMINMGPIPSAPKPAQQPIDPTAAALEPKPAEKPKRPAKIYQIPTDETPGLCSSCGDAIHWIVTEAHRRMPVDAFGDRAGQSHFITCKHANEHRKPR